MEIGYCSLTRENLFCNFTVEIACARFSVGIACTKLLCAELAWRASLHGRLAVFVADRPAGLGVGASR